MLNGNTKRIVKPRKFTIAVFITALTESPGLNRKRLIEATGYGSYCIDCCIAHLLSTGDIKAVFIRMSGPYKVFNYELKE